MASRSLAKSTPPVAAAGMPAGVGCAGAAEAAGLSWALAAPGRSPGEAGAKRAAVRAARARSARRSGEIGKVGIGTSAATDGITRGQVATIVSPRVGRDAGPGPRSAHQADDGLERVGAALQDRGDPFEERQAQAVAAGQLAGQVGGAE